MLIWAQSWIICLPLALISVICHQIAKHSQTIHTSAVVEVRTVAISQWWFGSKKGGRKRPWARSPAVSPRKCQDQNSPDKIKCLLARSNVSSQDQMCLLASAKIKCLCQKSHAAVDQCEARIFFLQPIRKQIEKCHYHQHRHHHHHHCENPHHGIMWNCPIRQIVGLWSAHQITLKANWRAHT